jgi:tetratricopeptide (TPR) repeat protein
MNAGPAGAGRPLKVFVSYSHRDDALRQRLGVHLSLLQRQGILQLWHDRCLIGGDDWAAAIDTALIEADLILLLISADFIASDYCYGKEMTLALERHQRGEARLVPVLLHPCDWESAPFSRCQGFPRDNRPISAHPAGEQGALSEVASELRRLAISLQRPQPTAHTPQAAAADAVATLRRRRWLPLVLALPLAAALPAGLLIGHRQAQAGLADLRLGAYGRAAQTFATARRWHPLSPLARCGAAAAAIGRRLGELHSASASLHTAVAALSPAGPCGALRLLFEGDLALEAWMSNRNPADWQRAQQRYDRALAVDGQLAEAEGRLGSLADVAGDLRGARRRFERAIALAGARSTLAQPYRNGLAKVLLQGDGADQARALLLLDGDRGNPAADLVAAIQLWRQPGGGPGGIGDGHGLALERLPARPPAALQGNGPTQPWGFKLAGGATTLVSRRLDQRCLLALARATTLQLAGRDAAANQTLAGGRGDCSEGEASLSAVICDRLLLAQPTNPRAAASRAWLGCPAERPQTRR